LVMIKRWIWLRRASVKALQIIYDPSPSSSAMVAIDVTLMNRAVLQFNIIGTYSSDHLLPTLQDPVRPPHT